MEAEVDRVTTFKIYVGNLPHDAKDEEVRKIFEEFGTVVQCECVGKKAFVHMEDDIEGKHAVGELQGRELNGNTLIIEEAKKNELPRIPTVKLLVKNINPTVDARGLRNMFKRFGYVVEVEVKNGEGHVCLEAIGDIRSAISEMNGYKIEDTELSVEPAPIQPDTATKDDAPDEEPAASSPQKNKNSFNKNKSYNNYTSSWARARQEYYKSAEYREDYNSYEYSEEDSYGYDYNSPWFNPPHSPFDSQPERILRDPYGQPRGMNNRGRGFRGAPIMPRGMPPRMPLLPPPMRGMPGRIMRSGNPHRGAPHRAPRPSFYNRGGNESIQRSSVPRHEEFSEEVFYEDEPISSVSRGRPQPKKAVSGANTIPLGGVMGAGTSSFPRRNGNGNVRGAGGAKRGGRGKQQPFTAVTEEVGPGEKYPVPPPHNPAFRAPWKRPKEEVKRKTKKKKKPLVPAELPDYSVPVPQLPDPKVPKGAVLKPFPPPSGQSLIDSDTFGGGGSGSTSFFEQQDGQQQQVSSSSQMDFTTDYME